MSSLARSLSRILDKIGIRRKERAGGQKTIKTTLLSIRSVTKPTQTPEVDNGNMKQFLIVFAIILFGMSMYRYIDTSILFREKVVSYKIEGKTYRVYVADMKEKREKGLMNIKKLKNADGMLFLFSDTQYRTFWNKNTYLDLDIFWINGNTITGTSFLPSIEKSKNIVTVSSPKQVNKVLEIISSKPQFPAEFLSQ